MALYRDQAIVLRTQKLGEADRIVTLLTREHGVKRAVAKGVRRTSSKFGARLEPFMVGDLQLFEGRNLDTVTQASTLGAYGPVITRDYDRYRAGSVMVETAERLCEGGPDPAQYQLLVGALRTLAQAKVPVALARDGYLLRAIAGAGWEPSFDTCVRCGSAHDLAAFSVQLGGVVCETCRQPGTPAVDQPTLHLLQALLTGDWPTALASTQYEQGQAEAIISAYTQYHLERGLRSLKLR